MRFVDWKGFELTRGSIEIRLDSNLFWPVCWNQNLLCKNLSVLYLGIKRAVQGIGGRYSNWNGCASFFSGSSETRIGEKKRGVKRGCCK
jgi:hypothetical protein